MQLIIDVIVASDVKKARCICETLSKDNRVALDRYHEETILKILDAKGDEKKKMFVQWLSDKVYTFKMRCLCRCLLVIFKKMSH